MTEMWLPIAGFEGFYSVSDAGRVRSEHRVVPRKDGGVCTRRQRILAHNINDSAHHQVRLWRDAKYHVRFVHRLVLEHFVGPCPDGLECLHIDGDPANNTVANLRWGTRSENALDCVRHGTNWKSRTTRCPQGHEYDDRNTRVTKRNHRVCRTCHRFRERARHARLVARRAA